MTDNLKNYWVVLKIMTVLSIIPVHTHPLSCYFCTIGLKGLNLPHLQQLVLLRMCSFQLEHYRCPHPLATPAESQVFDSTLHCRSQSALKAG